MKTKLLAFVLTASLITACGNLPFSSKSQGVGTKANTSDTGSFSNQIETKETPKTNISTYKKNLLALGNAAFAVSVTSESSWKAYSILDELPRYGWASESGKILNQSITVALPAQTTFKNFAFDTAETENNTGAKDITVEISDVSATDGFQEILAATLKDKQNAQEFSSNQTISGRWLRINFKSNYGSTNYVELMDVRGYGDQETLAPLENISGTYESNYGNFHIKQEGTSVVGCYEYAGGLFEGGIENRVMKLHWNEGGEEKSGPALMVFSQDGKQFSGLYGRGTIDDGFLGKWDGKKISDKVGSCEHLKTLETGNAAQDQIEKNLEKTGRAVIYGINFDFNSDVIKNESKPTLDQILAILKENKDWKMTIEGHTDNIGGDSFNKTLSEKRANAVKIYLIGAGIEVSRLSASGMGISKPVAANETEAGRAQNRRVELIKQ